MATKQPTQLCYQVNGGTCRNKVSAKNYYVCAAGHRAVKGMGRDEIATQLSVEAICKMGRDAQHELATNPSIDRDIAQALFDTGDTWVKRHLAKNPSIDRDMAQALFGTRDKDIWSGLATNPSIDRDMAQALFDIGDDWIRRALATNPSIDREMAQALFDTGNKWVRYNLATNPSIDRDMIQALFATRDKDIWSGLARNPSIDREMAVALAKSGHVPGGYLKKKSLNELYKKESMSLLNEYPKEFGKAYLGYLLNSDENLEEMKALLCYSYNSYVKAGGNDSFNFYKNQILERYPGDEEIKILLSQDS